MSSTFLTLLNHSFKSKLFLLTKLPAAFFSGVRLKQATEEQCVATVPYKWFSQNPFRSTYFACLAMAAELTTGALAMTHIYKRKPAVSMLIVKMEANYFKKATGRTTFTCSDGLHIKELVEKAITTGEAQTFTARSIGTNTEGQPVAEFLFTWSFKARTTI
jgi:acyl-coenzyme A thioesterase PaaI-like protein